jgi:hypothetical protein
MTAFAIPSFSYFGKQQSFSQKVEELKLLMNKTYLSARNPELGVIAYSVQNKDENAFVLKKCFDDTCYDDNSEVVETISLSKDQSIYCTGSANSCFLKCSTNVAEKCEIGIGSSWSVWDGAISKRATFLFKGVKSSTIDQPFDFSYQIKNK